MAPLLPAKTVSAHESQCAGCGNGLRVRVYRPDARKVAPPVLVYFHPGRFISGGLDEAEEIGRALAGRFGVAVVTPAYTLAAQQPFPAAAEDAYAALKWTHDNAAPALWSGRRIAVIGEEAGGNLAAVAAMMARDRGGPCLAAQVLLSPMLDPTLSSSSMRVAADASKSCGEAYDSYLPHTADRMHPYAAPMLCSRLQGLPPALILTVENDALRDEAQQYAAKLIGAGVRTQVTRLAQAGWSAQAWREIGDFLGPLLSPPRTRAGSSSS
jgi:acetyl esterase/lipase